MSPQHEISRPTKEPIQHCDPLRCEQTLSKLKSRLMSTETQKLGHHLTFSVTAYH